MSKNDTHFNNTGKAMSEIVNSYQNMAQDSSNHPEMMKDKTMIQFLAYSLDSEDPETVETSLKTIQLLVQNSRNHNTLKSTFGVMEALHATCERTDDLSESIITLARQVYRQLDSPGPAYNTRSCTSILSDINKRKFSSKVFSFHVFGLSQDTRNDLESTLVSIRGVISVVVDVEHQRCTVRVVDRVKSEALISTITEKTDLKARMIVRNKMNQEVLLAGTDDDQIPREEYSLPDYLPEEESPVKEKALHPFDRIKASAAGLINTATSFFQNSFYW